MIRIVCSLIARSSSKHIAGGAALAHEGRARLLEARGLYYSIVWHSML